MSKQEFSTGEVAKMLKVGERTVRRWCLQALDGESKVLRNVRQHPLTGRYRVDAADVRVLRARISDF